MNNSSIRNIAIIFFALNLFACNNLSEEINSSTNHYNPCYMYWEIETDDSGMKIFFLDSLKKSIACPYENCIYELLNDSTNDVLFLFYFENIILINCSAGKIFLYDDLQHIYKNEKISMKIWKESYIFSTNNNFYIFNNRLIPLYVSWDFIKSISPEKRLGLSGLNINYKINDSTILLKYNLYTDLHPYDLGQIFDTIYYENFHNY